MESKDLSEKIIKLLANYLGVEPEDVAEEDSLTQDLHIQTTELSDFLNVLEEKEIDTSRVDLTEIESVGDLIEAIIEA